LLVKFLRRLKKITPQILLHKATAQALHLIFFAHAQKRKFLFLGVRWHTKNAYMPYQAFISHFSMLALTGFVYMFFCLDAKEPKNQGCEKIG